MKLWSALLKSSMNGSVSFEHSYRVHESFHILYTQIDVCGHTLDLKWMLSYKLLSVKSQIGFANRKMMIGRFHVSTLLSAVIHFVVVVESVFVVVVDVAVFFNKQIAFKLRPRLFLVRGVRVFDLFCRIQDVGFGLLYQPQHIVLGLIELMVM